MNAPVFITHSSLDYKKSRAVVDALEKHGIRCWISERDIGAGENYGDAIVDAIERASVMVLVFSANANNSDEIKKEIALASQRKITVVPVRLEEAAPSKAFRYELVTRNWIDLFADWDGAIERLVERISSLTGAPIAPQVVAQPPLGHRLSPIWIAAITSGAVLAGGSYFLLPNRHFEQPASLGVASVSVPARPVNTSEVRAAPSSTRPSDPSLVAAAETAPQPVAPKTLNTSSTSSEPEVDPAAASPSRSTSSVPPQSGPATTANAGLKVETPSSSDQASNDAPAPAIPDTERLPARLSTPSEPSPTAVTSIDAPVQPVNNIEAPPASSATPALNASPAPAAEAPPEAVVPTAPAPSSGPGVQTAALVPVAPVKPPQPTSSVPPRSKPATKANAGVKIGAPVFAADTRGGQVFKDCENCPEMVVVPRGSAVLGSPLGEPGRQANEETPHVVTIAQPFAVGRFTVTFDQWAACVADGGCNQYRPDDDGFGRGDRPVIFVSWNDAQAYVEWLKKKTGQPYRLLSEAEWEYAARGCSTPNCPDAPFWFGTIRPEVANYDSRFAYEGSPKAERQLQTMPVGTANANPFGLFNMLGNVQQWVEDCWNAAPKPTSDGAPVLTGDCADRVIRGGSWSDKPEDLRAAARSWDDATDREAPNIGIRVARTLSP